MYQVLLIKIILIFYREMLDIFIFLSKCNNIKKNIIVPELIDINTRINKFLLLIHHQFHKSF